MSEYTDYDGSQPDRNGASVMRERRCLDCGAALVKGLSDHPYRYDHGTPVKLRSITRWSCTCGNYEIVIPKMGPLHETIAQALTAHAKREDLAFFFEAGSRGVEDGVWKVIVAPGNAQAQENV